MPLARRSGRGVRGEGNFWSQMRHRSLSSAGPGSYRDVHMALTVAREDLAALEPEWREILPRCSYAPVFLSPAWLRTWWGEFGAGRELMLLSVRDDQRLAGVVPLMREGARLSFAGDTEVCDY